MNRRVQRANPPLTALPPRPLGPLLPNEPIELVGYFAPLPRHVLLILLDGRFKFLDYRAQDFSFFFTPHSFAPFTLLDELPAFLALGARPAWN